MLHYSDLIIALRFSSDLHFDVVAEHCYTRDNTHSIDLQGKWQQHPQQLGQPAHSPMTLQVYTGTNWPHDSSMVTTVSTRIGKHKFVAYMALHHSDYTRLLKSSAAATTVLTDAELQASASYDDEARRWTSMSRDLQYATFSSTYDICSGSAATVVKQKPLETTTASRPSGSYTKGFHYLLVQGSIGYLTTSLKPKCEEQSFEENFLQCGYAVARYELDNGQGLPDTVKIAILLNETKGALQQHLQLRAGQVTTYAAMRSIVLEYSKATTAVSKLKMMHNPTTNNYKVFNQWTLG